MLQTRPSKVRLIYADEGGLFQKYLHSLPESFASTLMSMLPIGDSGGIGRARTYRSNISNLRPILSDLDGCDMYVFSPQRPESRFLLEKVSGRKIFVEDGLEAYIPAAKL